MTSHSKISQFNWECIERCILIFSSRRFGETCCLLVRGSGGGWAVWEERTCGLCKKVANIVPVTKHRPCVRVRLTDWQLSIVCLNATLRASQPCIISAVDSVYIVKTFYFKAILILSSTWAEVWQAVFSLVIAFGQNKLTRTFHP